MQNNYARRSVRLKNYDYSQAGAYFVTICTQKKEYLFGTIKDGKIVLNDAGEIVNEFCTKTESHFTNTIFDAFVIMPNHFHAIITVGAGFPRPVKNQIHDGRGDPAPTLGNIVGFFKYQTTKQINILRQTPGHKLWQRNYYEHVIRDENDYQRIYKYIQNNPLKWASDSLHPQNCTDAAHRVPIDQKS